MKRKMGIKIVKAGMLTTVQDLGRIGFQKSGMVVGGAMDNLALRLGNIILGNSENEAGLECTTIGPTIIFTESQLISITGGDLSPSLDGVPVSMWKPIYITAGSIISFGHPKTGCRTYICFYGGLAIPVVLNSRSTYIRGKIGGFNGRVLEKDDYIEFRDLYKNYRKNFNWSLDNSIYPFLSSRTIRITDGPYLDQLDCDSLKTFLSKKFTISNQSDRMGYRLGSEILNLKNKVELLSSAVNLGTIQLPPQGNPIILMADRPTTGGYPIIGQVALVDIPLIAQLRPQDQVIFKLISLNDAQLLLKKRNKQIRRLKEAIALKYE